MRVLVMGGTGEVGHDVANGLLKRGHDVTVLTRGRDQRGFELTEARERFGYAPASDMRSSVRLVVEWARRSGRISGCG